MDFKFASVIQRPPTAIPATVQTTDNQGTVLATHSVAISPHGTKIVNLAELQSVAGTEGGIRVDYNAPSDTLEINGGLEDPSVGYSANIRFGSGPATSAKISQMSVAELGLMIGAADPMMLFPSGTTFTPYSVIRNISDAPITVTPTVWWMQSGVAQSAVLQTLTLAPGYSRSLDVMSLIPAAGLKNFNGNMNLEFDVQGKEGGLLLQAGSVDQTNIYVFEVNPHGVLESGSKSLGYWSTANGDNTMVTLWNPADEAQDFVFRLAFSGGHYLLPMHLGPREARNFNISEIIQNQVPDAEGNIIPAAVQEGSATIAGSHTDAEAILIALDAGIYNVRKATCGGGCIYCDGYTGFAMSPGSASFTVQHTKQYQALGTWSSGAQYNVANSWSSNNTPVAPINGSGLASGVSGGSAQFSAPYGPDVIYTGNTCFTNGSPYCPAPPASGTMQGTGTVQVPSSLSIVSGTDSTTAEASCAGGTGCGCTRSFTYQVKDQNGNPIQQAGLDVWDSISTSSPNNLNLQSYNTTCSPANTGPCGVVTNSSGQFQESSLSACAPACKSNNQCVTGGPTNANQTWHVGLGTIVKQVGYYCDHVTVQ